MNNYSNMQYYMPDSQNDFDYLNQLNNFQLNNQMMNNQKNMVKTNKDSQMLDPMLQKKLAVQAGDNMMFNKSNYHQQVTQNNLYDVYGGFIRGNMFKDLYNQYKNIKPFDIKPMNKQAEMLTYIDAYGFAAHDLNLYLDNNPNDRNAIELFKEFTNQKNQIVSEYERTYGPLFVDASLTYPWAWNESPWPWENQ